MKKFLCVGILLGTLAGVLAQTNNLTGLLQQGLFEEQANRNLEAAIADYQTLATQFDKDRQLAATAVFRLGECYRAQGRTNEAAMEYQRIIREFGDQQMLATLSQQDLAGMGLSEPATKPTTGEETSGAHPATTEAALLATQISGIEKLKADPEEQARAVLAIFPDDTLKDMLLNLPKLQDQVIKVKANPQLTYGDLLNSLGVRTSIPQTVRRPHPGTNLLAYVQSELDKQRPAIQERVDFMVDIQKARLKALQAASGSSAPGNVQNETTAIVTSDEDKEIQRIQEMIQNSPDLINAPGGGSTPLVKAAYNGWLKVAAYLLDHGADVNIASPNMRWSEDLFGAATPLTAAVAAGNKAMTKFLVDHGADVNFKSGNDNTALHLAAKKGFQAVTEVLLASHVDVNARNNSGVTPLDAAVQGGQLKIVQMILADGADVNAKDNNGRTALNYAVSPEIVQALLTAGVDPNTRDAAGRTPLSYAAEKDSPDLVKMLLAGKADPNDGKDAPLFGAISDKDTVVAEMLLSAGADPNLVDRERHQTPLSPAISLNELPMVQLLLQHKADPNDQQTGDDSLLFDAMPRTNIFAALLEAGANADYHKPDGWSPLSLAVRDNNLMAVQLLLKFKADPNHSLLKNNSLLFTAIYNTNMLEALLDAGAEVDAKTKDEANWTPLANAANQNLATAVEILLKHDANPNVRNSNGATPLHWAAYRCVDTNIFELLLDHGADPNVRSSNGRTPLDELKRLSPSQNSWLARFSSSEAEAAHIQELIAVLHRHGALDNPPDWNSIIVSRPAADFSFAILHRATNDWNHFTLLETLENFYFSSQLYWRNSEGSAVSGMLPFPDLTHVVVVRPNRGSTNETRMVVNLLNSTNGIDCSKDVPLEFGDVVEVPERDHALGDNASGLTGEQAAALGNYVKGSVQLVVRDKKVQIPIYRLGNEATLDAVLANSDAQNILLASSDLSRVKVIRHEAKAGEQHEWMFDCRAPGSNNAPGTFSVSTSPGQPLAYQWNLNNGGNDSPSPNGFWLRNGDVIEVPEKQ